MAKKKAGIIEGELKNIIKKEVTKLSQQNEEDSDFIGSPTEEDEETLKTIFSAFPSAEGYYGKLYKVTRGGNYDFKYSMDDIDQIADPELELSSLISEKNWGDGEYKICIHKRGVSDPIRTHKFHIAMEAKESKNQEPVEKESLADKMKEFSNVLDNVRKFIPSEKATSITDPIETAKIIQETFNAGVEAVNKMHPSDKGNTPDPTAMLTNMITVLAKLGVFDKPAPVEKFDMLTEIIKLRETGLIKLAGEEKREDPMDSFSKLAQMMEALAPFMGKGNIETPTLGELAIKTIGPSIPNMVKDIADSIRNVIKIKTVPQPALPPGESVEPVMTYPHSEAGINPASAFPYEKTADIPLPDEISEASMSGRPANNNVNEPIVNTAGDNNNMNPVLKELIVAIKNQDSNYYSTLTELITLYLGEHVIESLINGNISPALLLKNVMHIDSSFGSDDAKKYLIEYVSWIKSAQVVAICASCQQQFDYRSEEQFKQDNQKCDCGGDLILAASVSETTPLNTFNLQGDNI